MKLGKLPVDVLERCVLSFRGVHRPEVIVPPAIGEDCAVLSLGEDLVVVSTDPITGASSEIGWYAVHVGCNDLAADGATPVGLTLTVLAPGETSDGHCLDQIQRAMEGANRAAAELGVAIVGGHTEITSAVTRLVVCVTAIGRVRRDKLITAKGARAGQLLIVTKTLGLEGASIIAREKRDRLERSIPREILERAASFAGQISVVKDGLAAAAGGAAAMHDITEGGLLGAVWELCRAAGCGAVIHRDAVPLEPETAAICAALGLDPLRLISSGSMLIAAPRESRVLEELEKAGVRATVIGQVTTTGVYMESGGRMLEIAPPDSDELWKVL